MNEIGPHWQTDPPPGWYQFGTHVDNPAPLEFWGEQYSTDGLPIWERPAPIVPSILRAVAQAEKDKKILAEYDNWDVL